MDPAADPVYTPSELNREARLRLEMGFPSVLVEAEISNLSRPASGHLYFSLKDERAQLRCAWFKSAVVRSGLQIENGMKVLAHGRISLYEPRGDYQLIVDKVQEAGVGELQRQFEALKKKLEAEGLFDPARKRALPPYPLRIGLVTSPRGAAVRDILHVLQRRWPLARVRLYPVLVQGEDAPAEICSALRAANRHAWAQLLIVGRGGGSLEDLAPFNDERVARALHASAVPVISAVGHETDFSISDFVADLRAPTPSAAAELAVPDQAALGERFARAERQLERRVRDRLRRDMQRIDHVGHRLQQRHPANRLAELSRRLELLRTGLRRGIGRTIETRQQRLQAVSRRLSALRPDRQLSVRAERIAAARRALERLARNAVLSRRQSLRDLARTLHAVSPLEVIGRGYAVLTSVDSGRVVSSVQEVDTGSSIDARLRDGRLRCTVDAVEPTDSAE
jgi:exodeoxyribonuclease VII large subunit